mgnify:FL=1
MRFADFRGAEQCPLAKTGALRQPRLRCFVHWTRSARLPSEAFTAVLKLDNDDD